MRSIGWSAGVGLAVAIASLAAAALSGQRSSEASRTRDGQPDLQGVWRFSTITPLERPAEFADKIVDSTNFTNLGDRFDENLHLIERFSRVDPETLLYEFTVDDPTVYIRPWTVVMPMKRSRDLLFEDACHEGNYALPNILRAVRLQEASR